MKLVKFQILGDNNYREKGIHPARLVDDETGEIVFEFAVRPEQLIQELVDEFLLPLSVTLE